MQWPTLFDHCTQSLFGFKAIHKANINVGFQPPNPTPMQHNIHIKRPQVKPIACDSTLVCAGY